jgi:TetR/AcrR family transcriptional regulator, regulator of mycofactocin system
MAVPPIDPSPVAEPGRRERKVAETRRAILHHARVLFESQGYNDTTVEQIAAAADVAPRTFFRYFPTKESLLFANFDEVRRSMLVELRARPLDEEPLDSIMHALRSMAATIEARHDEVVWGFRMCAAQNVDGVYERTMLKEDTNAQLAGFIAERLGVDPDEDPRPLTWAMAIMGVFAAAMKFSSGGQAVPRPGAAVALLDELLEGTAQALLRCAAVPS